MNFTSTAACLGLLLIATTGLAIEADDVSELNRWEGFSQTDEAREDSAILTVPGAARFTYPDGDQDWYRLGMAFAHDGSADWHEEYGLRFEIYQPASGLLQGQCVLEAAPRLEGSRYVARNMKADFGVTQAGWNTVTLVFDRFDFEYDRRDSLTAIKTIRLSFADATESEIQVRNLRLVKGDPIAIETPVLSRSARPGESATYAIHLTNETDTPQAVNLLHQRFGREAMSVALENPALTLQPGETRISNVAVTVDPRVTPGGREIQKILVTANGQAAGEVELITLSYLEHPYILHTPERWDAVKKKIDQHEWAAEAAAEYIRRADAWKVPEISGAISSRTNSEYLFRSGTERDVLGAAVAYELTGDERYADKVALFLRRLTDPETGYPKTQQVNQNNLVKEGGFFQKIALAYDIIYNAEAMTPQDHENIEISFRIYFDIIDAHIVNGTVSNWFVSEILGAIFCAMAIQDMAMVDHFIESPGGMYDQITHGIMSDGWWFECSIGYNAWVAQMFTQLALAMQPWGVDYLHASFPASYSLEYNVPYADVEQRKRDYYGKPFQKYGPVHRPYVKIQDMWDALIPYIDYQGVMFAVNDSVESRFSGDAYEMAYAVYAKPEYASILKFGDKRNLLYGVPELPADTPALGYGSSFSDNAGVVMLRSEAEGKPPREKIQAVMKYGTHGGYHGHFDRVGLNSLMRYGRSFYNPEHIWYSYPNYMYAFFVQTSLPHNMVVVDMKQQEPVDSRKLLYSTCDVMQVTAVETNARWSNPPYGGLAYANYAGQPFKNKIWDEGRYLPIPEDAPEWGSIGEYGPRVMQRRLMAVTDDYVVLADYLESEEEHTFDNSFQIKGFKGLDAESVELTRETDSMDPNPLLAAQLITNCKWYDTTGTVKAAFETQFGPDADNAGTRIYGLDGVLKMDVYSAWPRESEVMIGTLPESHRVNRRFWYTVVGNGKTLQEGKFGAWVLGRDEIDVSLEGVETLELKTKAEFGKKAPKTLFWGNPVVVTSDGKTHNLSDLSPKFEGIDSSPENGRDYYDGPVKIAGREFAQTLPANPTESEQTGSVTIDLTDLDAVRLKADVGGDYPLGDETWRRKTLSFRTTGNKARYLTVIEPYEDKSVVDSVSASSANELTIKLTDGRVHKITVDNLEIGEQLNVTLQEYHDGELTLERKTQ